MIRIPYSEIALINPDELKSDFAHNGILHIGSVFDKQTCSDAIDSIVKQEKNLNESNTVSLVTEKIGNDVFVKYYQNIYHLSPSFRKFFSSKILDIGKILLGRSDLYFADLEAHIRNPGGGEIPKHQDNFYFNLKNACGFTCYVALTEHDQYTGGLNYKLKSHAKVLNHSPSTNPGFSSYLRDNDITPKVPQKVYSPKYSIGDISIHHPNNIHWASPVAISSDRGFALSIRVFSQSDSIDEKGIERYKKLLEKNRG